MHDMSMGKRKRDRQAVMWVPTTDLPTAASHPFFRRLNQLLREHGFDDFAEAQCVSFYAESISRPGLPPGIHSFPAAADRLFRRHRFGASIGCATQDTQLKAVVAGMLPEGRRNF